MKSLKIENTAELIEATRRAFNDFMNYTELKDQLRWQEVSEEFFRINMGFEPKNKVLNKFIFSVLELD